MKIVLGQEHIEEALKQYISNNFNQEVSSIDFDTEDQTIEADIQLVSELEPVVAARVVTTKPKTRASKTVSKPKAQLEPVEEEVGVTKAVEPEDDFPLPESTPKAPAKVEAKVEQTSGAEEETPRKSLFGNLKKPS